VPPWQPDHRCCASPLGGVSGRSQLGRLRIAMQAAQRSPDRTHRFCVRRHKVEVPYSQYTYPICLALRLASNRDICGWHSSSSKSRRNLQCSARQQAAVLRHPVDRMIRLLSYGSVDSALRPLVPGAGRRQVRATVKLAMLLTAAMNAPASACRSSPNSILTSSGVSVWKRSWAMTTCTAGWMRPMASSRAVAHVR
jgi:hypothetical protein